MFFLFFKPSIIVSHVRNSRQRETSCFDDVRCRQQLYLYPCAPLVQFYHSPPCLAASSTRPSRSSYASSDTFTCAFIRHRARQHHCDRSVTAASVAFPIHISSRYHGSLAMEAGSPSLVDYNAKPYGFRYTIILPRRAILDPGSGDPHEDLSRSAGREWR